jgi:hypothetical protein
MGGRRFSACFRNSACPIDRDARHAFDDLARPIPPLQSTRLSSLRVAERRSNPACCGRQANPSALNPLSFVRASRNGDVKPLDLLRAVGEAYLQFKPIVVGGIPFGSIERDQDWKFSRQALLDIGRAECRAAHGDSTMLGPNGQADRGQRTGCAVGAHAGIDTDTHLAPGRVLTSRSSDVVCAPAALTVHSATAATAHHAALICSRATFLPELDVSPCISRDGRLPALW